MKLLIDTYRHYLRSNTFEKGAALSYYTVFSLLPIIMIISSLLGAIFGKDAISSEMTDMLASIVGDQGAKLFEDNIKHSQMSHDNLYTTIIGSVTLLLAATGMFNQIQKSLNAIWGLIPKPEKSVFNYIFRRATSLFLLIIFAVILLLSTTLNSLLIKFSSRLPEAFSNAYIYEFIISFFLIAFLFTMLFRFIGNAIVPWKTALVTAGITSILFLIGKLGVGIYISYSSINSTFGTASAIAILMIWVYYTSQILFIGASFGYVYGQKTGREIKPKRHAVRYIRKELR